VGFFDKIKRHAAMASGNFHVMFKGVEIPPLPIAIQRLITEINNENPDISTLAKLISSATGISAKVIQTVNSSYYSPRSPVTEIGQAVMFLGINNIRALVLAYTAMEAIPKPKGDIFDHEAYWIDSLLKAFLSRCVATVRFNKDLGEEAFTASLISDIALPVLLSVWNDYYEPIIKKWRESSERLSEIERNAFGWDHAQAGAWVVQSWGFPDKLVCYIGAHNLSMAEIRKLELDDTIVVPMAIAALSPSVLKPHGQTSKTMYRQALTVMNITPVDFIAFVNSIRVSFNDVLNLFELSDRGANNILDQLMHYAQEDAEGN
jgi:HD-like signal output (HDOD) protein